VAGVSHELRTPLTQIRMFAETLLLGRVRSDDEHRRALTVIDQESRRLGQLVENVLQFSRGERGTLRLSKSRIDLSDIVRTTIETFKPIAAARNVTIKTTLEPSLVDADADAISQIVLNLLDNAVKYGPAGGEVRVTVGNARIIVEDDGPGIPPSDRKRIWRRYERLDTNRAIGGAGIGLAVVKELTTLHGGKAWVEDKARFIVELPA
jgi:signal transduction histidine kinase